MPPKIRYVARLDQRKMVARADLQRPAHVQLVARSELPRLPGRVDLMV
jgi:hypothetical protein